MRTVIFCDFDRTIVEENIFHKIMEEFNSSDWLLVTKSWLNGRITTKESLEKHVDHLNCNEAELKEFLNQFSVTPYFRSWLDYCRRNNFEVYILSEGLDYYIQYIMGRYGVYVPIFSHHLVFSNGKAFSCYGGKDTFGGRCGRFKAQMCRGITGNETRIIVIGDDISDFTIAGMADFVLAKNDLVFFCERNNIPYASYENFLEILCIMKRLKQQ